MPDADGRIRPVTVPTVPWLQEFMPGDRVRTIRGFLVDGGTWEGTVMRADRGDTVTVLFDDGVCGRDHIWMQNAYLRPVTP